MGFALLSAVAYLRNLSEQPSRIYSACKKQKLMNQSSRKNGYLNSSHNGTLKSNNIGTIARSGEAILELRSSSVKTFVVVLQYRLNTILEGMVPTIKRVEQLPATSKT